MAFRSNSELADPFRTDTIVKSNAKLSTTSDDFDSIKLEELCDSCSIRIEIICSNVNKMG